MTNQYGHHPDSRVDVAAQAIASKHWHWDKLGEDERDRFRDRARAVLAALDEQAPAVRAGSDADQPLPDTNALFAALLGLPPGEVFADAFGSDARAVAANLMQACREDSMSDRTRILIGQAIGLILKKANA